MSQLAVRAEPVAAELYVESIAATIECVVTERVTALREPVAVRPEHAFKIVGLVVETIAGFAIGSVAGELARGARRWFGGADGDALSRLVRAGVPAVSPERLVIARRFLADAETRPFVDELGARLQPRLRYAIAEIRQLVEATAAAIPEARHATASAMFDRLIGESMFDDQLAEAIEHGWQCACAAIEHAPMPQLAGSSRSRALWLAWSELAGLCRSAPARTPLEVAGYITLVQ